MRLVDVGKWSSGSLWGLRCSRLLLNLLTGWTAVGFRCPLLSLLLIVLIGDEMCDLFVQEEFNFLCGEEKKKQENQLV